MGRHSISIAALAVSVLSPSFNAFVAGQVAAGCTSNSFTIPSWVIQELTTYSTSNSTVTTLDALNRATNEVVEFRCLSSNSVDGWHTCSGRNRTEATLPYTVAFKPEGENALLRFNETWTCNDVDKSNPITFTAFGNGNASLTCEAASGGTLCQVSKPVFVRASLSSPVKITPKYVSGPPNHAEPGCTAASANTTWEVVATQMNIQAPVTDYPRGSAFVIFQNDYLGYNAICAGAYTGTAEPAVLQCSGQGSYRRPEKYQVRSTVIYDPVTHDFTIDQTWYCDDEDASQPLAITAQAKTTLDLHCDQLAQQTIFCSGGSEPFSGTITKKEELPPYSLNDPLSTASSCTIASVAAPAWWLSSFETSTTRDQGQSATVRFGMELLTGTASNVAPTGLGAYIVAHGVPSDSQNIPLDDLPWNKCVVEAASDWNLAPTECEFKYQASSRYLGIRVGWTCSDLDPESPITFKGELSTTVTELTCVTASNGDINCKSQNAQPWRVNATSVTWE